ncbi:hypothetical protein D3Y57_05380 [Sphingomonas paeninsulae]|uniref:Uncharacterized protein n=1 Tax=Sphingomonas paeninsulae TaxID=2319844 RepID=A0A494TES3_SPHPE|nr:hypothetical protein [Sphingomonas paeninsulae]AYJ85513.1 hypothetical protein D3Y57_05380 [Sphingomonas paeninsulae]
MKYTETVVAISALPKNLYDSTTQADEDFEVQAAALAYKDTETGANLTFSFSPEDDEIEIEADGPFIGVFSAREFLAIAVALGLYTV